MSATPASRPREATTSISLPESSERLLTVGDVSDLLQVAATFVYRHASQLGAIKVGSHLRFRRQDVEAWLEAQRRAGECRTHVDNRNHEERIRSRRRRKKG